MIGVDEVGRGCWAGPLLVVAARATSDLPPGLRDSKVMTRAQRDKTAALLQSSCEFGEGWVSASEIDAFGLAGAMRLGVGRALSKLRAGIGDEIIFDGSVNYINQKFTNVKCLINGDSLIPLVSAASIYAKVQRDKYMSELAKNHPTYGFDKHVGYGTAAHRVAISQYGVITGVHRLSFKPVKQLAGV